MTGRPRILLICTNNLGDCVAFLPVAAALRRLAPEAHIAFLGRSVGAQAAQITGTINEVIPFAPPSASRQWDRSCAWLDLASRVRRGQFDIAFIASGESSRLVATAYFGRVPRRVGFDDCRLRRMLSDRVEAREPELEALRNLRLLPVAGFDGTLVRPPLAIPDACRAEARALLAKLAGDQRPRVLIHVGSSSPLRRWPAQHFANLCTRLLDTTGAQPILLEGPAESGLAAEVARAAGRPLPVVMGLTDIAQLVAVIAESDLFLGVSSGPLHLAFLTGTPSVSLWGDTNPLLWGPAWEADRHTLIRTPLPCGGCERWDPRTHRILRGPAPGASPLPPSDRCLAAIPVNAVFAALAARLQGV